MKKRNYYLLMLLLLFCLSLSGCALLQVPLALLEVPLKLLGEVLKIVQKMPMPPPWVFF